MRKRDRLVTCLEGTALSFMIGMSSISCMVTAFQMTLTDLWLLAVVCAVTALVCGICYSFRLGLIPLCIVALASGYLWQSGILAQGFESLVYRLTRTYNAAYGWGILRWSYRTAEEMELTLAPFLYISGGVITLITAWTVCRHRSLMWAAAPALLPVLCCFVVTDTLPELSWLFLFMVGFVVLMISSTTRTEDPVQGNRLTAMIFLPVVLAVGLLFFLNPEAGYDRQKEAQQLCDTLFGESPLQRLWDDITGQTILVGSSVDGNTVDLTKVGYRQNSQTEIMRVNTRYTGTLYLRGRALDGYEGTGWYDTQIDPELYWPAIGNMESIGEVVITTRYAHRMLYLPYYVTSIDTNHVTRGVENEDRLSMYSFTCRVAGDDEHFYPTPDTSPEEYIGSDASYQEACTQLPEETLEWAVPLVNELTRDMVSPKHQAEAIAGYVRNSAAYDLETRRMPARQKDFARWFLEESDTGYCVHFATAATVLLKAAGIPARYVTGYMADVTAGETTVVRAENAHAWVEYWLPGFGWTVLEATPADTEPQQTQASAATQPSQENEPNPSEETEAAPPQLPEKDPQQSGQMSERLPSLLPVLLWLAGGLGIIGLIVLQWRLRVLLRHRKRHRGDRNRQAIAHWQEAVFLYRLLKRQPEQSLYTLAEKAKFSQYTLTEQELAVFDICLDTARQQLRQKHPFFRLYCTLILAAW